MRPHHTLIVLFLIAGSPDKSPAQQPAPARDANPLANFERLVSDEWRVTAQSGKSFFHNWHWGPGKHSIRRMTDGSGAGGEPWRVMMAVYWHPTHKQVRFLGMEPFARGISEGTIKFEGEAADATFDLHQTGGRRELALRWAFDGPDKFRETLLEVTGQAGYKPFNELDNVRTKPPAAARSRTVEGAKPSKHLKALEPLLGHTWEAKGEWAGGEALHVQSTFEWVPIADAIYARVVVPGKAGEPTHLIDAYLYHHTGADKLRCLALSNQGGVYEGDITVLDGALQLDLKGYEGDRVVNLAVRLDFEKEGTLRQGIWSLKNTGRTPLLDVRHKKMEPKK